MRKLCINIRLNTKSSNIVTPRTKKKTKPSLFICNSDLPEIQILKELKFKGAWSQNRALLKSRAFCPGHSLSWQAPSFRQHLQARQMACVSFLDSTGQTLPHSFSIFCLFWTLWALQSSFFHCHCSIALLRFNTLSKCISGPKLINCWFHVKSAASWWQQRGSLIALVGSSHMMTCRAGWLCFLENGLL